ncbi:c4-dicarboxylate transporter/malic acid transport domain-containing protein [Rhizoctonia solani AG-1 IA]|uniref:C4-dicarboxylate transporter/malic acid transport domain-containing protein n=1 Tax=Thanatephorus cucumeris (strain AG1-IA) TaxID=983506 RepID=L8WPW6_THACA|nr:c4-dicarboxylate transporter/malic acid transport domain-containing protein [Rhizoctonia solani AG-1 IA]
MVVVNYSAQMSESIGAGSAGNLGTSAAQNVNRSPRNISDFLADRAKLSHTCIVTGSPGSVALAFSLFAGTFQLLLCSLTTNHTNRPEITTKRETKGLCAILPPHTVTADCVATSNPDWVYDTGSLYVFRSLIGYHGHVPGTPRYPHDLAIRLQPSRQHLRTSVGVSAFQDGLRRYGHACQVKPTICTAQCNIHNGRALRRASLQCSQPAYTWMVLAIGMWYRISDRISRLIALCSSLLEWVPAPSMFSYRPLAPIRVGISANIHQINAEGVNAVFRRQSLRLLSDPVKGVFVPLSVLSFATIVIGTINYAVPAGIISASVSFPMLMIWFNKPHDITTFTPAWAFLVRNVASILPPRKARRPDHVVIPASDSRALGILLVGYFFQGIGFFMTFFYLAIYVLRIITTGFMSGHQANGAFVACGPPGFTALALINLGASAREIFPQHDLVSPIAGEIFYAASVLSALLLFGLVFFFAFGVLPYWFKLHKHLHEILGCWALTFPNVGWINTIMALRKIFNIPGFDEWHLVMTIMVCVTWLVLFCLTIVAFWKGEVFMSRDEDIYADAPIAKPKPEDMV